MKVNMVIPIVSVIIPMYNSERTIKIALKSVLSQTLHDLEVICLDDSSQDSTYEVVKKIQNDDPRVKLIRMPHSGQASLRNLGMNIATGRFVSFLDSDDIYPEKDSLHVMSSFADLNMVDICGGLRINKTGIRKRMHYKFREELKGCKDGLVLNYDDYQYDYDFSDYIYRKDFLLRNKIGFPNLKAYEDPVFLLESMLISKRFGVVPVDSYQYTYVPAFKKHWDTDKVHDLVRGMTMNLRISAENEFGILHTEIVKRFNKEYYPVIRSFLVSGDVELRELLNEASDCIVPRLIRDTRYMKIDVLNEFPEK